MAGEVQINQEALQRAALTKEGTLTASKDAAVQQQEALIRKKLEATPGGATSANLAEITRTRAKFTEGVDSSAADANIGTEISPDGTKPRDAKREPEAASRHTQATEATQANRTLSNEGYDKLPDPVKQRVRLQFDNAIKDTALAGLETAELDKVFKEYVSDPTFLHLLRTEHVRLTDQRIADKVTEAQRKYTEAQAREKGAKVKRDRIERELVGRRAAQKLYEAGGDSAEAMAKLASSPAKVKSITARMTSHNTLISSLNAQIALGKGGPDALTTVQRLQGELETMGTDLETAESEAAQYTALKEGKSGLPDRISDLEGRLDEAEQAYQEATANTGAAVGELGRARSERNGAERQWISELENAPELAFSQYIQGKMGTANQAAAEALLELEKGATDARDKKMASYARTQFWRAKKPTFWNKSTVEPNREAVMRNMDLITNPKVGPEDIVRHALRTQGLSKAEIDQQMGDSAFVNKWAAEYSQQLFGSYIRLGGKVTPDMYEYISNQPWGEQIFEKAIEKNDAIKDVEAKLKASGHLGPDGLAGYLKTKKKTLAAGVLAALLAGVFGGIPGILSTAVVAGAGSGAIDAGKHAYSQG